MMNLLFALLFLAGIAVPAFSAEDSCTRVPEAKVKAAAFCASPKGKKSKVCAPLRKCTLKEPSKASDTTPPSK